MNHDTNCTGITIYLTDYSILPTDINTLTIARKSNLFFTHYSTSGTNLINMHMYVIYDINT